MDGRSSTNKNFEILDDRESFDRILARMTQAEQDYWYSLKHNQYQTVFLDRVFYIYRCAGKDRDNKQRAPEVLGLVKVINFHFDLAHGFSISLLNEMSNQKQVVTVIPAKLFGFDVIVRVPPSFSLKTNIVRARDGTENLDHSAGLYVKTSNKPEFYSKGVTYMNTPQEMARLCPDQNWHPGQQEI